MKKQIVLRFLQILIIVVVNHIHLSSQTTNFIKGIVVDSESGKPLSFASVGLKESLIGVFANADGDFKIIRDTRFESDSLVISCIGYRLKTLSFKDLHVSDVNIILLEPTLYNLNEVRVTAMIEEINPFNIIDKAIRNIKKNYSRVPFGYVAYYRDYQKQKNDYVNLNEAIIEAKDNGFGRNSVSNNYQLLDFKQNPDFRRMNIPHYYAKLLTPDSDDKKKFIQSATLPDQGGNEFFILMVHDAIRNYKTSSFSFVNVFSRDFLTNHEFSNIIPTYDDDLLLYKINFKAKRWLTGDSIYIYGSIYIEPRQYSIHKLDYSGAYLMKGEERKEMFNITIEYGYKKPTDTQMFLKYISFNNIFNVIDTTDTDYFRIAESYFWDIAPNSIHLVFNNKVDSLPALNKECYTVLLDEKEVNITNVSVSDSMVVLSFDNSILKKQGNPKYSVWAQNLKDVSGRVLNERRFLELYQYRELFVQEYKKAFILEEACQLIDKPLRENCISKEPGTNKYWMNTPVNPQKSNK
jgi:hypothetical protein